MDSETASTAATSLPLEHDRPNAGFDADSLHIEWSGDQSRPGVVLLHGWGSSAELMRPIARSLSDSFRVANVDLPGHGRSPVPTTSLGVPEHADLVYAMIRKHFGDPVSIVGHSNGGRIAMYMASDPSMMQVIDRLVLVGPSGIKPHRTASFYVRKYLARGLKAPFEVLPGKFRESGLDWLRHSLLWNLLGSSDYRRLTGVMRDTFVKTVSTYLDDQVHTITAPTLIFWGDQDQEIGREQVTSLEQKIPDAGLVVLPNAGHYAYLDDPITFLRATRFFLEKSDTARS
ncbi:MAG: alpha/beta hydrolase [Rhodothermales bacterium]|nr:alpha/beta hydrolase [Rhodothermales bacterium]